MYGNTRSFVAGALVGGLIALVLAPKSGRELRGDIEEHSVRLKNGAYELAGDIKEKGSNLSKEVSIKSSELVGALKERISKDNEISEEVPSDY